MAPYGEKEGRTSGDKHGLGPTCARKNHLTCAREVDLLVEGSRPKSHLRTQAGCYIGIDFLPSGGSQKAGTIELASLL